MKTFTVQLFTLLLCTLTAFGQGFGFNPVAHMAPRPPQCWVDAKQFIEAGAADRTIITSQMVDYSGHGFTWGDTHPTKTNVQYLTRLTGCISSMFAGSVRGLSSTIPNSNDCQTIMMTGPGSEAKILKGGHTNQCTIAVRVNYRTGSGILVKTGDNGTPGYAYPQLLGDVYWDFGAAGANRINKTIPSDFANAWVNVFFTRSKTNQDIWMGGPTGAVTNWHTGLGNGLLLSGGGGSGSPGIFELFSMGGLTNWYIKRVLIWDYQLPPADIAAWNRYMTYLP